MTKLLKDNGLVITMLGIFLLCLVTQALTGWSAENGQRAMHGGPATTLAAFLGSGAFLSSVFENWESEFLEKCAFILLTAWLYQRGSAGSKDPDKDAPEDRDPALYTEKRGAPWPVRAGGFVRVLYSHSLLILLVVLFLVTFAFHVWNSARHAAAEALQHGRILVRKLPELAERVPFDRSAHSAGDIPE